MAKQRPSLESFAQQAAPQPDAAPIRAPLDQPVAEKQADLAPIRRDRPHTTLYLDRRVQRVIKEIAIQYDRKPHDLYIEGIEMMLRHYGRPRINDICK